MKSKGFTLIELLAVIIILGIIAMIAIPTVASIIKESKKNSVNLSAKNYIKALENDLFMDNEIEDGEYDIKDFNININNKNIPNSGSVIIKNKSVIYYKLEYENYTVIDKDGEREILDSEDIPEESILKSTGSAGVDTGILASSKLKIETEVYLPTSNASAALFGGREAFTTNTFTFFTNVNKEIAFRNDYNNTNGLLIKYTLKDEYIKIIKDKNRVMIDKYNIDTTAGAGEFTSASNVYLLAVNTAGTLSNYSPNGTKVKYFKIYEGDVLVRYFVPVKKGSIIYLKDAPTEDCFFDIVTNKYYYSKTKNSLIYETIS